MHDRWRRRILALQALYYLATGLWPLVHLPSFEVVTGPKTDDWLVHMVVGLLAMVSGASLGVAVIRDRPARPRRWFWRLGRHWPSAVSTCGMA
jgi:hypothetical protein